MVQREAGKMWQPKGGESSEGDHSAWAEEGGC